MRMKMVTFASTVFATCLFVLSAGAVPTKCYGADCPIPVEGNYSSTDRNFAEAMAVANCKAQCSHDYCQEYGELPGSQCGGTLCKESNNTGCRFMWDMGHVEPDGDIRWAAYAEGECPCTSCGGDGWPAGAKIGGLPYQSPILTPIQSFIRRLFGSGK